MASAEASPVDRKSKATKPSSNSYTTEEWQRQRPLITQLYFGEGRTLKVVAEYMKKELDFTPTPLGSERMYKSWLHKWGLDKKKKEHEMLGLVRQALQHKGEDRDKVFHVRGRQVTLADALHYFQQLVDAFETTSSKQCYEVCHALGSMSEVYFHMNQYQQSLQALRAAVDRAKTLFRREEQEIYARCLREWPR
ncbi:hypothetical protein LTR41_011497 [Exophiala xenobiotica]|nr:hypothetical protein LTR41_011497 [Exophiala xenobiotica]KAK5550748.1 hypothetical protein LTR46_011238 [Exophiala xenobiotica]